MRFARPDLMYCFLAVFALVLFYLWAFQARRKAREKFAQKELLKELLASYDEARRKFKIILVIFAVVVAIFSCLRPQWGFSWTEVKKRGLDIIIALDTSKSMLAQDIKPNRLERSKLAIRDFIKNLKGDRIGLIAFAGSAFLECPLTVDYGGFLLSLEALGTDTISKGGTSLTTAIKESLKSFEAGEKKYDCLVLITDGEDNAGDPVRAAEEAKKAGITVYCIGIGTTEGELIPAADEAGAGGFLKDREGNIVKSRLDEATLQKIAFATGGSYFRATSMEFGLDLLYRERLSKMEKKELEGKMNRQYKERFQVPLAIALVLLLLEPLINDRRRG